MVQTVSCLCGCSSSELWVMTVCGYKCPLLGLGLFVIWSLGPGPCLVVISLKSGLSALSVFSALVLLAYTSHDALLHFGLSSTFILIGCVSMLAAAFGPKLFVSWSEISVPQTEEEEQQRKTRNRELRNRSLQLGLEIDRLRRELFYPGSTQESTHKYPESTQETPPEVTGVRGRPVWTHEAPVCSEERGTEEDRINSTKHVCGPISLQLPILHHSYLPAVVGVSPSSSHASLH
ncbi:hypothetical protein NQD34_012476 [Periophthalmus magnuspinnatus]|nr:hypothetical protein NQD34_012476 [Periophthalmus magnuspinnatus]